jgi:hypothetical protein
MGELDPDLAGLIDPQNVMPRGVLARGNERAELFNRGVLRQVHDIPPSSETPAI